MFQMGTVYTVSSKRGGGLLSSLLQEHFMLHDVEKVIMNWKGGQGRAM